MKADDYQALQDMLWGSEKLLDRVIMTGAPPSVEAMVHLVAVHTLVVKALNYTRRHLAQLELPLPEALPEPHDEQPAQSAWEDLAPPEQILPANEAPPLGDTSAPADVDDIWPASYFRPNNLSKTMKQRAKHCSSCREGMPYADKSRTEHYHIIMGPGMGEEHPVYMPCTGINIPPEIPGKPVPHRRARKAVAS